MYIRKYQLCHCTYVIPHIVNINFSLVRQNSFGKYFGFCKCICAILPYSKFLCTKSLHNLIMYNVYHLILNLILKFDTRNTWKEYYNEKFK